ncbi:MAG TPA: HEAT repeat domain-containing protein [Terriglobales bacterium]|nr:HEAT repeat domain-containing protein [Terriglobales bacterium]
MILIANVASCQVGAAIEFGGRPTQNCALTIDRVVKGHYAGKQIRINFGSANLGNPAGPRLVMATARGGEYNAIPTLPALLPVGDQSAVGSTPPEQVAQIIANSLAPGALPVADQLQAVRALTQLYLPASQSGLESVLSSGNLDLRMAAEDALLQHGDAAAVPYAFADLEHDNGALAMSLGGMIKDPAALPTLLREVRSPLPGARAAAASALGNIGSPLAIPALARGLDDPAENVRFQAMTALARITHEPWSPPRPPRYAAVEPLYLRFWREWLAEHPEPAKP